MDRDFAAAVWRRLRPEWTQAGWWDAELRAEVRDLLWLPVGTDLQQALTAMAARDRADGYEPGVCRFDHATVSVAERLGVPGNPCGCQVVMVAAWNAVASWVSAHAEQVLVEVAGAEPVEELLIPDRPDLGHLTDPAVEDLAPALRVSPGSARHRLSGLRRVAALPRLTAAIRSGLVIAWHAHLLVGDLRHLEPADREVVVDELLNRLTTRRERGLREWTFTDLRAQAKKIAARLDLDLAARRQECHRNRGIRLRLHGQGAATLSADLADDTATRIYHRLTALAHGLDADSDGPDGPRTVEQRRADVFIDLLLGVPGFGHASSAEEPSTAAVPEDGAATAPGCLAGAVAGSEVAVVIDAATLLRLNDDPAHLPGCGPIPAEIARQVAADARWRAWITRTTDAGTQVVATSPGTYRPTAALARLIRAREPECRMPGCRATITDLDHITPFPRGSTTPRNLGSLCRRHHRLKTFTRWRQSTHPDPDDPSDQPWNPISDPLRNKPAPHGADLRSPTTGWTWTSPTGISYTDHPDPPLG